MTRAKEGETLSEKFALLYKELDCREERRRNSRLSGVKKRNLEFGGSLQGVEEEDLFP